MKNGTPWSAPCSKLPLRGESRRRRLSGLTASSSAATLRIAPAGAFLTLRLEEHAAAVCVICRSASPIRVWLTVHPEVAGTWNSPAIAGDVDHKGVERWVAAIQAAVMERLHEPGDCLGLPAVVELLRRHQPSCLEHKGVVDERSTILCAVSGHVVDCSIDTLLGELHGHGGNASRGSESSAPARTRRGPVLRFGEFVHCAAPT